MKYLEQFNPKVFAAMVVVCSVISGIAAWLTGLNFWALMAITTAAIFINGLLATLEDKGSEKTPDTD